MAKHNKDADLEKILDYVGKAFDSEINRCKKDVEPFIEKARASIKHPHFIYAVVDTDKLEITYHRKKWYKWFSGKRIVGIKIKPIGVKIEPIYSSGLMECKPTEKKRK